MFIEELGNNFYRLVIPLNIEALRSVNVYAIRGKDLSLIVDTGMGTDDLFFRLCEALSSLKIRLRESLVFITHFHIDHFGFAKKMILAGARLLISSKDWKKVKRIRSAILKEEAISFLHLCGYPANREEFSFFDDVDPLYDVEKSFRIHFVSDSKKIDIGGYQFVTILTPGHTPGHLTLYEPSEGLYISGDHILKEISPTVQARKANDDPLSDYLISLEKVSRLNINRVFPSHGKPFDNARHRIKELFYHHEKRLKEIVSLLQKGDRTIYELASHMEWDTDVVDFHELPMRHKIFAMGEAFAHANYLRNRGKIIYTFDVDKNAYICSLKYGREKE